MSDPEFASRAEEMREEALTDHYASHHGHTGDRGGAAHRYDEGLGFEPTETEDWLARAEAGHTGHGLSKHVGRGDDEMAAFGTYDKPAGASTFLTPADQAGVHDEVLDRRATEVEDWLSDDTAPERMRFDADLDRDTGLWARSDLGEPAAVSGAAVVLAKCGDGPHGYTDLTSFPVPADTVSDKGAWEIPMSMVDPAELGEDEVQDWVGETFEDGPDAGQAPDGDRGGWG
ncbi:hypothetical protein O7628_13585 [Micromonospora sp. WMMD956]|uniref:RNase A-like domain-containing protein n=1 Tax=Micromonospora sp. WMMD956 TaxID=3016108 RepID=UPI00241607E0|nr:RNase A-like domain-containing protein [Micromonospora sp. WMMD956]MDG4816529.1 hypothetical protein [Micromonospora sp. WMMD956]